MLRLEKMPVTLIISLVYANCSFNEILMLPCKIKKSSLFQFYYIALHAIGLFNSKLRHVFILSGRLERRKTGGVCFQKLEFSSTRRRINVIKIHEKWDGILKNNKWITTLNEINLPLILFAGFKDFS